MLTDGESIGQVRETTKPTAAPYDFDLEAMTVTRMPSSTAGVTINDRTRPIRKIVSCQVGEGGYWTMLSEGGYVDPIDFYWQATSAIRRIERLEEDDVE